MKTISHTKLLFTSFFIFISLFSHAQNQFIDTTFGENMGYTNYPVSEYSFYNPTAELVEIDDILYAGSNIKNINFQSYFRNGHFNEDFGTNGHLGTINIYNPPPVNTISVSLHVTSDNKLLLLSGAKSNFFPLTERALATKVNLDGTLDLSYGTNGHYYSQLDKIFIHIGSFLNSSDESTLVGVSGKAIIVTKLDSNGNLIDSFGNNGVGYIFNDMDLYPFKAFVVNDNIYILYRQVYADDHQFYVRKFDALSLAQDMEFGINGDVLITNFPGKELPTEIFLDDNENLYVAGRIGMEMSFGHEIFIEKYSNGELDSSFGENGTVKFEFVDDKQSIPETRKITIHNNKLVLAGSVSLYPDITKYGFIAQFNLDGSIDYSFGCNGKIINCLFAEAPFGKGENYIDDFIYRNDSIFTIGVCPSSTPNQVTPCITKYITNVSAEILTYDTLFVCPGDSLLVFDEWVYGNASLVDTVSNLHYCNNIISTEVILLFTNEIESSFEICANDSIFIGGNWVKEPGEYPAIYSSIHGCDSTHTYHVSFLPENITYDTVSVCVGDSIVVFNEWIYDESTVSASYTDIDFCDSISSINVRFLPAIEEESSLGLCPNDSIYINGNWITEAGIYEETYNSIYGCDSIHTYQVTILEENMDMETVYLCPNDSIFIDNSWIFTEGKYSETLSNINGCDSTQLYEVFSIDTPSAPTYEIDCENSLIIASVNETPPWSLMWSNGDITPITTYEQITEASLILQTPSDCVYEYALTFPSIPSITTIPTIPDTTIEIPGETFYNIGLDPSAWKVDWSPADVISCDTCLNTSIHVQDDIEISLLFTHKETGCEFTKTFAITLGESVKIYTPTAFSPDGDQNNDIWQVFSSSESITFKEFYVFDRWGNLLKASKDKVPSWDGIFKGNIVSQGVYYYTFSYINELGETINFIGEFTVLR